jgi:hypothetical protein
VRTALAVLKDEAELCGLYAPKKIAPTNPDGDKPYALTDAQRLAALKRLLASVEAGDGRAGADGPVAADGQVPGGPGEGACGGGPDAGPVAGEPAEGDLGEGPPPLFPPVL